MRNLQKDIELLHNLTDQVDDYTLTHFKQRDYQVYEKPDFTPVSDIDRGAEQMIRDFLKVHRSPRFSLRGRIRRKRCRS